MSRRSKKGQGAKRPAAKEQSRGKLRIAAAAAALTASMLVSGCERREPITYNLEAVRSTEAAGEAALVSEEYQVVSSHWYEYQGLGQWMGGGATASVLETEPGKLIVFTEGEEGSFQWRDVYYAYGFFDTEEMRGREADGGSPFVIAPVLMSADGTAVAYQDMRDDGYMLALSQMGQETILLDGGGRIYEDDEAIGPEAEYDWSRFEYCWSADGRQLFYYKMTRRDNIPGDETVQSEEETVQEGEDGEEDRENEILEPERGTAEGDVLMFPCGVFGYDRDSGQVREIWEPMVVEISGDSTQVASIAADAADGQAVMFILFNDENSGQDILLWKDGEEESMRLLDLQDDPRLQIRMSDGIYYCRDNGEILRCAISGDEQETLLYVGSGLETFLVTEDESRIFTVEMRGETEDICLYTRDGEGNWRKQVLYVGAEGARYLQLSADGSELLAECPGASGTMALVLSFGVSNAAE